MSLYCRDLILNKELNENIELNIFKEIFNEPEIREFNLHITEFWLCQFAKYCGYESRTKKRTRNLNINKILKPQVFK